MAGSALSPRTAAQPLGGRKRKRKTPMGVSSTSSTSKSVGEDRCQVDRCCNCTRNSICSMLGPSNRACNFQNARRQCTDCVCWRQGKNHGAFLPRTQGEGLLGHFHAVENIPHPNASHHREPFLAHGTEGGHAYREEEEERCTK